MNNVKAFRHLLLSQIQRAGVILEAKGLRSELEELRQMASHLQFEGAEEGFIEIRMTDSKERVTVSLEDFSFYGKMQDGKDLVGQKNSFQARKVLYDILLKRAIKPIKPLEDFLLKPGSGHSISVSGDHPPLQIIAMTGLVVAGFLPGLSHSAPLLLGFMALFTFLVCQQIHPSFLENYVLCVLTLVGLSVVNQQFESSLLYYVLVLYALLLWESTRYGFLAAMVCGPMLALFMRLNPVLGVAFSIGLGILFLVIKIIFPRFSFKKTIPLLGTFILFWIVLRPPIGNLAPRADFKASLINALDIFHAVSGLIHISWIHPWIFLILTLLFLLIAGWFTGSQRAPLRSLIIIPILMTTMAALNVEIRPVLVPMAVIILCLFSKFLEPLSPRSARWIPWTMMMVFVVWMRWVGKTHL